MFCVSSLVLAFALAVLGITGCAPTAQDSGAIPAVVPPVVPKEADLGSPERAVKSYTDWISFAYRVLDSEVATHTFTPHEEVRVNSYVQYNRIEGRGIEQFLADADYEQLKSRGATATLVGDEFWRYRYFDIEETRYLTGPLEASYDVTYTVVRQTDGRWLVDKVDVNRLDEPAAQE
jgi:hypothetical protein